MILRMRTSQRPSVVCQLARRNRSDAVKQTPHTDKIQHPLRKKCNLAPTTTSKPKPTKDIPEDNPTAPETHDTATSPSEKPEGTPVKPTADRTEEDQVMEAKTDHDEERTVRIGSTRHCSNSFSPSQRSQCRTHADFETTDPSRPRFALYNPDFVVRSSPLRQSREKINAQFLFSRVLLQHAK